MKIFKGWYETIDDFEETSLIKTKNKIDIEMQKNDFKDYHTAWIMEYNLIHRQSKQHYFSMKDKKWHYLKVSPMSYISWNGAMEPFKSIVQWYLKTFGYKDEQDRKTKEWIKQRDNADNA